MLPTTTSSTATPLAYVSSVSLYEAAEGGNVSSLRRLLLGSVETYHLEYCLLVAGNADVVRVILGDARLSVDEDLGENAVYRAARCGRVSALEALLQAGFSSPGAMFVAAVEGHAACMDALLRCGCDPNTTDDYNYTALHMAARYAQDDCVRVLLEAGADVMATTFATCWTKGGWTPLHEAAFNGATQCARLLINAGADVNAANGDNKTPLQLASRFARKEVALLLLERGARR